MSHQIFGRRVDIIGDDSSAFHLLTKELSSYPGPSDESSDIEIFYASSKDTLDFPASFRTSFSAVDVGLHLDDESLAASFSIRSSRNPVIEFVRKWRFSQFSNRTERIGMIFHENVLIPMFFFVQGALPVHGAGVVGNDGKAILFGGGGGTGKTTMELELCLNHGYGFLCDDFAVVTHEGLIHPNLAYPKIYGYNLVGNQKLQTLLEQSQGFFDKIHWRWKERQGLDQVRRRFSPHELYNSTATSPTSLGTYVFLNRAEVSDLHVRRIEPPEMTDLTIEVIKSEYRHFFQPIQNSGISLPVGEWRSTLLSALDTTLCLKADIPVSMDNATYRESLIRAMSLA